MQGSRIRVEMSTGRTRGPGGGGGRGGGSRGGGGYGGGGGQRRDFRRRRYVIPWHVTISSSSCTILLILNYLTKFHNFLDSGLELESLVSPSLTLL